ncbi:hypothetical protein AXG93_3363s1000 [Marchantia polymorpha subsp. ruderalis]|uniref:Uncharacterized protein n=1 Tax=Marchantia polymorpha subsp. ruderalis TaxID=1480154 RepID=A0A176WN93_MARPO|nr:hypothetical protein AXG93_3363s1000 [Marchantia polymorpha subsp. ruderalis]
MSSQGLRPLEKKQLILEKSSRSSERAKGVESSIADFLQDTVVPLLKYLDGEREKYTMSKEARFYVEMLMNSTRSKRAALVKTAEEMKSECAAETTSLKVRKEELWAKDIKCEVLQLNLAKEREFCAEEALRPEDLWREIMTIKLERMDLRGRIGARTHAHNKEF